MNPLIEIPNALMARLHYEPESGILTWKYDAGANGCIKSGSRAGSKRPNGYRFVKFQRRYYREHRIAYQLAGMVVPAGFEIDHVNGVPDDNRLSNLRLATHQENIVNGRHRKNNTSGRKGVHLHAKTGRWRARIQVNRHSVHLGLFDSLEAAHAAYMDAAKRYFGEFARAA